MSKEGMVELCENDVEILAPLESMHNIETSGEKKPRELAKRDVPSTNGHLTTSVCDKYICTCLKHSVLCRDEKM